MGTAMPIDARLAFAREIREQKIRQFRSGRLPQRYLGRLHIREGITFLKSPRNTGKTYSIGELVRGSESAIYIAHLVSLVSDACARLELHDYQDRQLRKANLHVAEVPRIGICINSLYKLSEGGYTIPRYEYLIIDEVEQLLRRLCSPDIRHKKTILNTLVWLIKSCKYIVLADADLGQLTRKFIDRISSGRPCANIANTYIDEGRKIRLYDSAEAVTKRMVCALQDGGRAYVASNSKAEAERIFEFVKIQLPLKRGLYVSSDNNRDVAVVEFLSDVNKHQHKYDYIITTPSINTGVSINSTEGRAAFDFVGGIFKSNITLPTDALQAVGRVRDAREIHIYAERKNNPSGKSPADVLESIKAIDRASELGLDMLERDFDSDGNAVIDSASLYARLYADVASAVTWGRYGYKYNLIKAAVLDGFDVEIVDGTSDVEVKRTVRAIGDSAYKDRISTAAKIGDNEATRLSELQKRTLGETSELTRHQIEKFYGDKIGTLAVAIEVDRRGATRREARRLSTTTLSDSVVTEAEERERVKLIPDRTQYRLLREFNDKLLGAVGAYVDEDGCLHNDCIRYSAESEQVRGFAEYCDLNKKLLGNICAMPKSVSASPIKFIGIQLRRLGLGQSLAYKAGGRGEQESFYTLDAAKFEFMSLLVVCSDTLASNKNNCRV
jgi:hypothetical protein